ncbi:MAG: hypothetical protein HC788_00915 [Sphingopyxis sp.]|nr:hypothetical protein [Sphingopyxis sp.]
MGVSFVTSNVWGGILLLAAACLALSGCFFLPGQFQSELDVRSDGRFNYRYVGTVVFLAPQERPQEPWDDAMANCLSETAEEVEPRTCSKDEIAIKREAYEAKGEAQRRESRELAMLIGYDVLNPEENEKLASELMQYPGWKDVRYLGNGKFYIDYEMSGTLDRQFAFPVVPGVQYAMPFVNLSRDKSGVISMTAGGLASQQFRKVMLGQMSKSDRDDPLTKESQALLNLSKGAFTVTTDADIVTTNGRQTGTGGARKIEWTIEGGSSETPAFELKPAG